MKQGHRLTNLDLLRGIAALMVCICHLGGTLVNENSDPNAFHFLFLLGRSGVYLFFVISGFVVPLSLCNGKFKVSNYFMFIHKRITRLHIPYLFALALTLIIMFVPALLKHRPIPENAQTIFQSLFYNHIPYNNLVFWTLAIEWQYYFFIGIFYCALARYPKLAVCIGIPALLLISQMELLPSIYFFSYIVFFLIGNTGFLIYRKQGSFFLNTLIIAGLVLFAFYQYGLTAFVSASSTILFILLYRKSIPKGLVFMGSISYSLYLIHCPIGLKFLDIPLPILQQSAWLLFFVDVFIVILFSYFFYKWIEIPSEKLARKLNYHQQRKTLFIPGSIAGAFRSRLKIKTVPD